MEMKVEQRIAASKERVWAALNDTDTLKASIPGCDLLEATSPTTYMAQVTAKVGPVKAKFSFDVSLTDINPPTSYTINAEGQGGAAGFANGSAAVTLKEDGNDTILAYHARANVGGKLAQLGARLIDGTAKKMADEFFGNFSALAANPALLNAEGKGETRADARKAYTVPLPAWVWALGLLVVATLAYILLR